MGCAWCPISIAWPWEAARAMQLSVNGTQSYVSLTSDEITSGFCGCWSWLRICMVQETFFWMDKFAVIYMLTDKNCSVCPCCGVYSTACDDRNHGIVLYQLSMTLLKRTERWNLTWHGVGNQVLPSEELPWSRSADVKKDSVCAPSNRGTKEPVSAIGVDNGDPYTS